MRIVGLIFLTFGAFFAIACTVGQNEPPTQPQVPQPTPDIPATVAASVWSTREAEAAIDAIVQAEVATILTAPQPTATPWPTATLWPTDTPYPTATPYPSPMPSPIISSLLATVIAPPPTPAPIATQTPAPTPTPKSAIPTITPTATIGTNEPIPLTRTPSPHASSNAMPTATTYLCPTGTSDDDWMREAFWHSIDLAQLERELYCGADPNVKMDYGFTPLHLTAVSNEDPAVVQSLIDAGADTEAKDNAGATPLHRAVGESRTPAVVQVLLDAGADFGAKTYDGATPLDYAAVAGKSELIQMLLEAGADNQARTFAGLLHLVAFSGNREAIQLLLDAGYDLGVKDNYGRTPLHLATRGSPAGIKALLGRWSQHRD